jgi:hypothetical protein
MPDHRVLIRIGVVVIALCAATAHAGGDAADLPHPLSHLDGVVSEVEHPGEAVDLAVSSYPSPREQAAGLPAPSLAWGEPAGSSLASDPWGNLYLAYVAGPAGAVVVSVLAADEAGWSGPVTLSLPGERAYDPVVQIVGDRLVVAYRTSAEHAVFRDLPLFPPVVLSVQDGPDGFPPSAR